MSTVAEIIAAVERLDKREQTRFFAELSCLESSSADPLEAFLGAFSSSGDASDWVKHHDAHLGEHGLEGSRADG